MPRSGLDLMMIYKTCVEFNVTDAIGKSNLKHLIKNNSVIFKMLKVLYV